MQEEALFVAMNNHPVSYKLLHIYTQVSSQNAGFSHKSVNFGVIVICEYEIFLLLF
jgi:hypothetical protein